MLTAGSRKCELTGRETVYSIYRWMPCFFHNGGMTVNHFVSRPRSFSGSGHGPGGEAGTHEVGVAGAGLAGAYLSAQI